MSGNRVGKTHGGAEGGPVGPAGAISDPRWFGRPDRPLFGSVHSPGPVAGAGAVVLCPPLFGELSATHATLRDLADRLASAGLWAVRFDYEGTGDSSGPTAGPGRVAAWLDSVDQALALARSLTSGPVALCGMRMGALLAATAASRRDDVDALVLWDPCWSGRTFLRKLRALQTLRFGTTPEPDAVEVPGYVLDAAMAAEVGALNMTAPPGVDRSLVVMRPGSRLPRWSPVAAPAPVVGWCDPGEQESLLDVDHLLRRQPDATSGRVVEWLSRVLGGATAKGAADGTVWSVSATCEVSMATPGGAVCERVVRLGELGLFGIETDAADATTLGTTPVVVFLTSGSDPHIGPSGLWVRLARSWAAAGLARCVRVDLSGWGESPPHPGRAPLVLRPIEAFDDVRQIAAAVGDPGDVVLAGLCSGGYQALESALEIHPGAVLAVNPLLRFTPPELAEDGIVSARRRICAAKPPWIGRTRARLPRRLAAAGTAVRTTASRVRSRRRSESWLAELVAAGVRVYCVGGEDEARPLLQAGSRSRAAWWSSGHLRVDVVPGLDHALLPVAQRDPVCDRLTEAMARISDTLRTEADTAGRLAEAAR